MNKNKSLRIVAMWLEGGKVQDYEMSGTRGQQLFEKTKLFEATKLFEETKLSKLSQRCRVSATL